jgi:hypothetical protein
MIATSGKSVLRGVMLRMRAAAGDINESIANTEK